MQSSGIPTNRVSIPFANSGTKNTIPNASQIGVTPGAASYTDGFPPLTFTPIAAGGVPPFGADFNGILNALSAWVLWFTATGSAAPWNSTYSTAIGGYPKGARIPKATLDGFWLNTVENNTTNPDTGGAGWLDDSSGRLINVQVFTNNATYTQTPGTKSVVVEVQGGGGSGGGAGTASAGNVSIGAGGGAGGYAIGRLTTGFNGTSVVVGAGGANSSSSGNAGGASSFGTINATGGNGGGLISNSSTYPATLTPANPGVGTGGNIYNSKGGQGSPPIAMSSSNFYSGTGGASKLGAGGEFQTATSNGSDAVSYGSGGGGASVAPSGTAKASGAGRAGLVIVWEYA